ncbi:MAG: hydroxymethylglutaryl-CoA lyase [Candidatus Aenigmatarchaeota archaeon]
MISIHEVGPRDGLQALPKIVTEQKIELINRLADAGLKFIEVASFVDAKIIPQMADASEVAKGIEKKKGVTYCALVPNIHYYNIAVASGIKHIAVFLSANNEHNMKNVGRSTKETKEEIKKILEAARDSILVKGYISVAFGYKSKSDVNVKNIVDISRWLFDIGVEKISLADTFGLAKPDDIKERVKAVSDETGVENLMLHLHCSDNCIKNIETAIEMGIYGFDSSVAGLGGCPTDELIGNVSTEDIVDFFESRKIHTGIDAKKIREISVWLKELTGSPRTTTEKFST